MTLRHTIGIFALVALCGAVVPLRAQTGLTVVVSAQCSATLTVDAATKPDARNGWGVQFLVNGAPSGNPDTKAPYQRAVAGPPGTYSLGAQWVRSGSPSVPLAPWAVECRGPVSTPPSAPVACPGSWVRGTAPHQTPPACPSVAPFVRPVVYQETFTPVATAPGNCVMPVPPSRLVTVQETCTPTTPPPVEVCGNGIDDDKDGQIDEGCPPPPTGDIFGDPIAPSILGSCSAATHNAHVVTREGRVYRTWHPQVEPSGCIYAHEHGDNPARLTDPTVTLPPPAFGYIVAKTPGHPFEPHEGFKIFIENPGSINDEDRVNRVYSRSIFHMGTGGPGRFSQRHHSAEIYVRHPEFGLLAHTQLMMDTGGTGIVCDPRSPAPNKDVVALDFVQRCGGKKLGSLYEIWSTEQSVRNAAGEEVYHAFATPAVFDPITVLNPANPTELVYIWDPRVDALKAFPENDWSGSRGCDRESYAQPGYWYNANGPTVYYTNSMGQSVPVTDPSALVQRISASNSIGAPATSDGLETFKSRPLRWCSNQAQLRYKN